MEKKIKQIVFVTFFIAFLVTCIAAYLEISQKEFLLAIMCVVIGCYILVLRLTQKNNTNEECTSSNEDNEGE